MKKPMVRFVVDERLDIENHLIGLWVYEKKFHSLAPTQNERFEKLLKLSPARRKHFLAQELAGRYTAPQKKILNALAAERNAAWSKMEKDFVQRIERVHARAFSFPQIRGVLSSGDRFGYDLKHRWFAINMYRNTFEGTDTAMHELMHFMFHTYYEKPCQAQGLTEQQIWDIKESFTALLNIEFDDLRFNWDRGYPEHQALRGVIKKAWLKYHDFEKTLAEAISFIKKNNNQK